MLQTLLMCWKVKNIGGAKEEVVYRSVRQDGIAIIMIKNATNFVYIIVKQEMQMDHVYAVKRNPIKIVILVLHVLIIHVLVHKPYFIFKTLKLNIIFM